MKRTLIIVFFFTTVLLLPGLVASSRDTRDATILTTTTTTPIIPVWLIDGTYGDIDGDTEVDDFCIWIAFDFTTYELPKTTRVSLTMEVTLPSGLTYTFLIDVWTKAIGYKTLEIVCLNGATESGWYEVQLTGVVHGLGSIIPIDDNIIFDPPLPKGSGSPTAYATWL